MIEVANLSKRYGELAAVRDASFTAPAGQILGFLGPNGAGKTTTMRIITGFLPATSGTVRVEGFDVFAQSSEVRRRIGYLPESPPLYNDMTVASYLRFVAKLKGMARGALAGRIVGGDQVATLTRGRPLEAVFIEAISRDTGDGARAAAATET